MFSDSIEEGIDPGETLAHYLDWLAGMAPSLAEKFRNAEDALAEAGHTFKTIESTPQSELKKIGIGYAIG
jgi:hypothetical protein